MTAVNLRKLSLKELKVLAGQKLGELAAKLKTKDELIAALEKLVAAAEVLKPKLVPVTVAEVKPAAPAPKQKFGEPKLPKAEAAPVRPAVVPKKVTPAPKTVAAVARPAAVATRLPEAALPKVTLPLTPDPAPARSLTVTQDFFIPPGTARLPAAHGDDRVLAFPRDTGGLYVSWDFSAGTWGDGPATLEVIEGDQVLAEVGVDAPWGGRFIDLTAQAPVFAVVRRGPALLGRSAFLSLPPGKAGAAPRKRLQVRWNEPLPTGSRPVPSDRPFRLSSTTRLERSGASSELRRIDEEAWDVSDVTSRMA